MTYARGDVVVASDPFGHAPRRPYLVVSNEDRPFQGEDYLVAGITTTASPAGIPLAGAYEIGSLDRDSYVSPWTVLTVRHDHVFKRVAVTSTDVVETAGDAIAGYVGAA